MLIKILVGDLFELGGCLLCGENLVIGYFVQYQFDLLDLQVSLLLYLQCIVFGECEQIFKDFFGGFDFCGVWVDELVLNFFGGEKVCLVLVLIVWQKFNLLLFDELINYFDLEMCLVLIMVLQEFFGVVLVVFYDWYLFKSIIDEFFLVVDGCVVLFDGDFDDYVCWLVDYCVCKVLQVEIVLGVLIECIDKCVQCQVVVVLCQQLVLYKCEVDKLECEFGGLYEKLVVIEVWLGDSVLYDVL